MELYKNIRVLGKETAIKIILNHFPPSTSVQQREKMKLYTQEIINIKTAKMLNST